MVTGESLRRYGAPLHVVKRREAGVPVERAQRRTVINEAALTALHQLFAASDAARNRYADSLAWAAIALLSEDEYIFSPLEI